MLNDDHHDNQYGGLMRTLLAFAVACAVALPAGTAAQDHQHALPDSAVSTPAPTGGPAAAQAHEMMCMHMMPSMAQAAQAADSLPDDPMAMMGEMMMTMGRMMRMMSQAGGMHHANPTVPPPPLTPPTTPPQD
jgi:hypothetical protein